MILVFDVYGTLLDVDSAVRRHAQLLGAEAEALSRLWRSKQLEYTWTRSLMQRYADFSTVTEEALEYALRRSGLEDREFASLLRTAYTELEPYPDAVGALGELHAQGHTLAVLSNATPAMLEAGLSHARLRELVAEIFSVDELGVYKPAPEVYGLAAERFGTAPSLIRFHSANAWDVAGAYAAGLQAVWINRTGSADEYGLRGSVIELASLSELAATVRDQVVPPTTPMP